MEGDVERSPVGTTIVQCLKPSLLGWTNLVAMKIQSDATVVTLNRKHFLQNGFQAVLNALGFVHSQLEELCVRFLLDLDQVWEVDDFLDLTEVNTFPLCRCHIANLYVAGLHRRDFPVSRIIIREKCFALCSRRSVDRVLFAPFQIKRGYRWRP